MVLAGGLQNCAAARPLDTNVPSACGPVCRCCWDSAMEIMFEECSHACYCLACHTEVLAHEYGRPAADSEWNVASTLPLACPMCRHVGPTRRVYI
eukprot:347637-Chlamydomonas_euryale.AAC.1